MASAAGVSRATASRVLSGRGPASAATRARVVSAADELHYVPYTAARALASRGGTRIAVAVGGRTAHVLNDPYVARVVATTAEVAAARDLGVSLHWVPLNEPAELTRLVDRRSVDAVVLVNPTAPALAAVPRSGRGRVAAIGIGSRHVPSFDVDNGAGTTGVAEHLLGGGRRRIAMIGGPTWLPCSHRAASAFQRAVDAAGAPARMVAGDYTAAGGAAAVTEILTRWPDTDAIFALGDLPALGALNALNRAGIDVPGDVAVAGFDDLAFASLTEPALTTTSHPVEQIAANAAVAVLERHAPSPSTLFPSTLIHRDST